MLKKLIDVQASLPSGLVTEEAWSRLRVIQLENKIDEVIDYLNKQEDDNDEGMSIEELLQAIKDVSGINPIMEGTRPNPKFNSNFKPGWTKEFLEGPGDVPYTSVKFKDPEPKWKVGDTGWYISEIQGSGLYIDYITFHTDIDFNYHIHVAKRKYFHTREQAEAALAEIKLVLEAYQ